MEHYTQFYKTWQNITKLYKQINKSFTTLLQNCFFQNYTKLFFLQNNFTKLYKTLLVSKIFKFVQNCIKLYNTLHNFTKLYTTLQDFYNTNSTKHYNTPQNFTNKCKLLTQHYKLYKTLQLFKPLFFVFFSKSLQSIHKQLCTTLTSFNKTLQRCTQFYKQQLYKQTLQDFTKLYNTLHNNTTLTNIPQIFTNSMTIYETIT